MKWKKLVQRNYPYNLNEYIENLSDLHVKDLYPLIANGNKVPMILRYNSPLWYKGKIPCKGKLPLSYP